jgi:hypothetical protein
MSGWRFPVSVPEPVRVKVDEGTLDVRLARFHKHLTGIDLITLNVPPGQVWFIESATFVIDPLNVDALRYAEMDIYRGANQIWLVQAPSISVAQTMSMMVCPNGQYFDGLEGISGGNNRISYRPLPVMPLLGGDVIHFVFGNWQLGDTCYVDLDTVEETL